MLGALGAYNVHKTILVFLVIKKPESWKSGDKNLTDIHYALKPCDEEENHCQISC